MKKILLLATMFVVCQEMHAQFSRYIIRIKDKTGTPFTTGNPSQFLTQRSIDRRLRYNIPIDNTDLPINPAYIDSIRLAGNVTILNTSKWLNQVCILTTDAAALAKINGFSFVLASSPLAARAALIPVNKQMDIAKDQPITAPERPQRPVDTYNYGLAYPQVDLHHGVFLHNLGFTGKGMQMAIMDAGFFHYKSLPTFDSVRLNKQILDTWDFVANEASVDEDYVHGMQCFSTIAANLPGSFVGSAPKTSFYLYRTEDIASEYPIEEQNWVAAAERADSLGVDVFSVSLGYTTFDNNSLNHTYSDMDGNTTIIARGSDLAAKKGILVVVAAGNDGSGSWKYISTPADADSVLTVGAVNAARQVAAFSSYGPSADGQIKPTVAALGQNAVVASPGNGSPIYGSGTSYACPIMAGIASCLWQAFPEISNMGIIDALRNASDRLNNPDDRTGYGIPDAKKAFVSLVKQLYHQQIILGSDCKTNISFTVKKAANMNVVIQRKLPLDTGFVAINTINFTGDFAPANFSYTDDLTALQPGIAIQYRLKMNIGADTSFYLDSATVNYIQSCSTVTEKIIVSPNPVTDQLHILIARNSSVKVMVVIHAMNGQKIYSSTTQVTGAQIINIPMKQVSRGMYFLTLYLDDRKELVRKFLRN